MKQIKVSEPLHDRLKNRAKAEGRKLYGLVEHLIEMGEEYESLLSGKVGSKRQAQTQK